MQFQENYHFTKGERRIIFLLVVLFICSYFIRYIPAEPKSFPYKSLDELIVVVPDTKQSNQILEGYTAATESKEKYAKGYSTAYEKKSNYKSSFKKSFERKREVFEFDPNTVSKEQIMRLGFKPYVADNWLKFKSSGMSFYGVDDLKSVYGIDTNLVSSLRTKIKFPLKPEFPKKFYKKPSEPIPMVDLNTASQELLEKLPGIGPSYASRIIKYRNILGGFHDLKQLKSVYGFPDSVFQKVVPYLQLSENIEKIKVNVASLDQLADHYLLDFKEAKLIVAYRTHHGPFIDEEDFKKLMGIEEDKKQGIVPYLDFRL